MKNIFRKNQVIITALAIMIVVAGYLTFTQENLGEQQANTDGVSNHIFSDIEDGTYEVMADGTILDLSEEDIQGDIAQDVNLEDFAEDSDEEEDDKENEQDEQSDNKDVEGTDEDSEKVADVDKEEIPGEAVLASTTIQQTYFSTVRIEREQYRSKNKEIYLDIINSDKLTDAQKKDAVDRMIALTTISEKENAAEILLGAQGYENVIVSMIEDKVNVVVKDDGLTAQQIAQIEDAVKSTTGVKADKLVIKPVKVE